MSEKRIAPSKPKRKRLERHFGGGGAVIDEFQKSAFLRPQRAIFWQIAARLAHQPHGRDGRTFALQDGHERLEARRIGTVARRVGAHRYSLLY